MSKRKLLNIYLQIVCVLLMLPSFATAQQPDMPAGWSDGYVYANGIRMHYYQAVPAPEKPVIVMFHGVTDNGLCWSTLTWELQDDYNIFMVDTRGHGLSDPFTSSDDGDTLVKDVVAFVEEKGFEKPILMGHSMGAATVMRVGAEYPELAEAIVMLDPGLGRGPGGQADDEDQEQDIDEETEENEEREGPPTPPQNPDQLSVSMFGSPETLVAQNNYSFEDLVALCQRQNSKWAMMDCHYWALSKKQYHGAYSSQKWQVMSGTMRTGNSLAKIPVPALILKADASLEERKTHKEAVSVMQDGELVHIDEAGHNLHHDELRRTVEEITEFLSDL
ncbi:alpha/beta hydrolase [Aliifodinibius sp. S!AR15-10]|uniref:alpha/beta fold hydrolase n=1 Tax=Aliifodinibius sp. S!AR15-10 TaxID=2950437 RepID=UPI002859200A|nr:alpha/beta hydrolase [Aliifodinibius sp. S!AR15-10]MDR8394194.1 alpha/beta hydrolase [Aliifodinibius sp. S!AR15-10]